MPSFQTAPARTCDSPNYGVSLLNQRIRNNASARIDWQLGAKNTFTARYGFWSESEHGDLNRAGASMPDATLPRMSRTPTTRCR